jgi:S-adenosylmethionine:tRNA ribosyltransferase-isomerase
MNLTDYDYDLPDKLIAQRPPKIRGSSRLLCLQKADGSLSDDYYRNLANYLRPKDLVVINNTKVLPARLLAQTQNGSERELLLLEKHGISKNKKDEHQALVMFRRTLRIGQQLSIGPYIIVVEQIFDNGTAKISSTVSLWEIAEQYGAVPLPPYMRRDADINDKERYQTIFAKEKGSVAAPTASLNLTSELLATIQDTGTSIAELTLHVGLGTFLPIRTDDVTKHKMHKEYFEIPQETIRAIRNTKQQGGRVIAVGTTVTRTLEYAKDQILRSQAPSLETTESISGEADIFIYPGYEFGIVDGLLTNFHAPQSTVLMMAAAFASWQHLHNAYQHAIEQQYQFLSYGDSMLIL